MEASILAELRSVVGPGYATDAPDALVCYAADGTYRPGRADAVVLPASTAEVAGVLRVAARRGIPVTPRGAGTGLSGGAVPQSGIALSLARMNRIVEVDRRNLLAVVEPGVVTADLQREVEALGLFYPPDPASNRVCTIGGNIAENAGGPRCFKYGVTRDYVLGLEVVLADGQVLRTGGRTVKNVTGYDLTRLIVGSEGTLGVVTQATLRLVPKPETAATVMAVFARLDDAAEASAAIVAGGVTPATLEIMDGLAIRVVENYLHLGLPVSAEAILLIEVDGFSEAVERQAGLVAAACRQHGATEVRQATAKDQREELWRARRSVSSAICQVKPLRVGEDVCVPVSRVPELIRRLQRLAEEVGLTMAVYGHIGDGNIHPNFVVDPRDAEEMARMEGALAEVARIALELGGTLSGEHGIGAAKAPFLEWEVGQLGLDVMRRIKQSLDPQFILNPGKMRLGAGLSSVNEP